MKNYKTPITSTSKSNFTFTVTFLMAISAWLLPFNVTLAAEDLGRLDYSRMTTAEVLTKAPEFSTLASLVPNSDIEAALMGDEIITVFAPNNEAFAKLSSSTVETLIMNPSLLNDVLNLHWVNGRVYTGYFYNERYYVPDGRTMIPLSSYNTKTFIGNAELVTTDISTRDGIIHIIDEVILPQDHQNQLMVPRANAEPTVRKPRPSRENSNNMSEIFDDSNDGLTSGNIVNTLMEYDQFSTLVGLVVEADLAEALSNSNAQLTVFAPTNEAFEKIDPNTLLTLSNEPDVLKSLLLDHVAGEILTEDEMDLYVDLVPVMSGNFLRYNRLNSPMVENARIIAPNLEATNGMIHVIDSVIEID